MLLFHAPADSSTVKAPALAFVLASIALGCDTTRADCKALAPEIETVRDAIELRAAVSSAPVEQRTAAVRALSDRRTKMLGDMAKVTVSNKDLSARDARIRGAARGVVEACSKEEAALAVLLTAKKNAPDPAEGKARVQQTYDAARRVASDCEQPVAGCPALLSLMDGASTASDATGFDAFARAFEAARVRDPDLRRDVAALVESLRAQAAYLRALRESRSALTVATDAESAAELQLESREREFEQAANDIVWCLH